MVERLNPYTLIEEPSFLSSDALVHVLHREADVVGEVIEGFFNVDHPRLGMDHRIEARVSPTGSFSPHICHDAPFLDFGRSITTFFSLLSFLLLILNGMFPIILLWWRRGAVGLKRGVGGLVLHAHWGLSLLLELVEELWWLFLLWAWCKITPPRWFHAVLYKVQSPCKAAHLCC